MGKAPPTSNTTEEESSVNNYKDNESAHMKPLDNQTALKLAKESTRETYRNSTPRIVRVSKNPDVYKEWSWDRKKKPRSYKSNILAFSKCKKVNTTF